MNKAKYLVPLAVGGLGVNAVQAQDSGLDAVVTGIGTEATTIVSAMGTVAVAALAVFGLIVGVRYCIRIFKAVK